MNQAKIVIGANYGDEGKGLMTDYFCRRAINRGLTCLNVCTNGGPQRGHTVVAPDGRRHVFHHFGSGTLAGADTYFCDAFIVNPMIFRQEYEALSSICNDLVVYVNNSCRWTTPYDMILNQMAEEHRGKARHGSCGYGIWETVLRYRNGIAARPFGECDEAAVRDVLVFLRDTYIPQRIQEIGLREIPEQWKEILSGAGLIENYIEDWRFFQNHTRQADDGVFDRYDTVVFENGQGLLLDMGRKEVLAHTTPSFTGLTDPMRILAGSHADIEVCYVTRTYLTRHGAGPMDNECGKSEINADMVDRTNVPNPFQGTLRYGLMDLVSLIDRIREDMQGSASFISAVSLAVTHLNETDGKIVSPDAGTDPHALCPQYFDKVYLSSTDCGQCIDVFGTNHEPSGTHGRK